MKSTFNARDYKGTGPENYQAFFVPAIGAPLASDLIAAASLRAGERVLDVACGTGVVARLAVPGVGDDGAVAGLDVNPGMLAVARSVTPDDMTIDWYETSAEAMPLPDNSFDVVLCQMGLQFMPQKQKAIAEIRRVLRPEGRALLSMPGPTPALMVGLAEGLATHIGPKAAGFIHAVFSLHEPDELRGLLSNAGFTAIAFERTRETLTLPAPAEFLWQYIYSTPLAAPVGEATDEQRQALEADVTERWQEFVTGGGMTLELPMTTVCAR